MFIREALSLDRGRSSKNVLGNAIGHTYLFKNNPIYRSIISSVENLGYGFVPCWGDYLSNGLCELDRILSSKKIPVRGNRVLLERIQAQTRVRIRIEAFPNPVESRHFHEAAHCLADSILRVLPVTTRKQRILKYLLSESFANACESVSYLYATKPLDFQALSMNYYIHHKYGVSQSMRALCKKLGAESLFLIILMSYLYSNFLYESVSRSEVRKWSRLLNCELNLASRQWAKLDRLIDNAFELNLNFRTATNQFFFNTKNMRGEITEMMDFDFLELLNGKQVYPQCVRNLVQLAIRGTTKLDG